MSAAILLELFYLGIVLFTSLGLSLLLTPLSMKLAMKYGFMDIPDKRKVHKEPVPRLGGLAIGMSLILTLILNVHLSRLIISYIVGLLFILLFGMLDDKRGLSPRLKYLLQLVPPAIFVFGSGIYLTSFGDLLGIGEIRLGALGPLLTLFCMAGVMNAINLSDGLDGLAAGKCLICAGYLFIFAYVSGHYLFAIVSTAVFGALLGFLAFNTHPARLFMGDSGSLALGYTMAVTTVGIVQASYGHPVRPISMAMVLALPIFDTLVVMGRRILTGKSIFSPDKTHFHHLLLRVGFSHPTAVGIIYVITFLFGTLAWSMRDLPDYLQFGVALLLLFLTYAYLVLNKEVSHDVPGEAERGNVSFKKGSSVPSYILSKFSFGILGSFLVVVAIFAKPDPTISLLAFGISLLMVLIFPWRGKKNDMIMGHGLMYIAIFFLTCVLTVSKPSSALLNVYNSLVLSLGVICLVLIFTDPKYRLIMMPSTYEVLLIIFSPLFVGHVFSEAFSIEKLNKFNIIFPSMLSVSIYGGLKVYLRRRCGLNKKLALLFVLFLIALGMKGIL